MRAGLSARRRWWTVEPARTDTPRLSSRRAYLEVLVVFGVFFASGVAAAAFSVNGSHLPSSVAGWSEAIPASIDQVATGILCVLVPVLLARRRQLHSSDLGLRTPAGADASQWVRIAAWAALALIVGSGVTAVLATGSYPLKSFTYPTLTVNLFHSLQAGPLEEIVVVAFLVTTLEQARRPRPEIIAVALLLRASYHIYYGPGVAGIFVWAAVFLWLFLRFRTILPLIAVHSLWDVMVILAHQWTAAAAIDSLLWTSLLVTSVILWLVHRANRQTPQGPLLAPPGWYPDPAGSGGIRWYDGRTWAPIAHPPPPSRW